MRRISAFATFGALGVTIRPQVQVRCSRNPEGRGVLAHGRSTTTFFGSTRAKPFTTCIPASALSLRQPNTSSHGVVASAQQSQMETEWNPVKVIENTVVCEDHRYLVVDVGVTDQVGSLCDAFRIPGMYVQLRENDACKPGFFAISCAPNLQGIFEFLIKDTPQVEWISRLTPGGIVEMSPVMGKGFPIAKELDLAHTSEEEKPRDILLFATGSGIAPIRSAIESRLNGIDPTSRRSVKLYYGARYPERMPYMDRFKLWKSDGIEVIPVMSRPTDSKTPWNGRTGYIQDAFRQDGVPCPAETGALLCGVKGMAQDVKQILLESGVRESRILFNF